MEEFSVVGEVDAEKSLSVPVMTVASRGLVVVVVVVVVVVDCPLL